MALHHQLPIYQLAYQLLSVAVDVTRNIPRDFKRLIGEKVREECVHMLVLIFRANVAKDKTSHIEELLERLQMSWINSLNISSKSNTTVATSMT